MSYSPKHTPEADLYSVYRRSFIERHICRNGRVLEEVVLVERAAGKQCGLLESTCRVSEEERFDNLWVDFTYAGYPLAIPMNNNDDPSAYLVGEDQQRFFVAGGGDNPLLRGGQAMAVFGMESIADMSPNSYEYAKRLFNFFEASELLDNDDSRTGYMMRRRSIHHGGQLASVDELCGILIGLFFFASAANRNNDVDRRDRAIQLLTRIGNTLQAHDYNLGGRGQEWVFQWPFGRVFDDITGSPQQSGQAIPYMPGVIGSAAATIGKTLVAAVTLDIDGLFTGKTVDLNYTAKDVFVDFLDTCPLVLRAALGLDIGVEVVSAGFLPDIKRNFFNAAMGAHAILMTLIARSTPADARELIANKGSYYFKQLCYAAGAVLPEDLAAPAYPGAHNPYFGLVAQKCIQDGDEDDADWRDFVRGMWSPLESPRDFWMHDLPLASIDGFGHPANVRVYGAGWGETFTWEHADPDHSFVQPSRLWNAADASKHIGVSAGALDDLTAETLAPLYGDALDLGKGFRVEAAGLDYLFPRMLATYFGLIDPPAVNEPDDGPIPSLPFDGVLGVGKFAGNRHRKKVHDMFALSVHCNYFKIAEEHLETYRRLVDAHRAGYDNCGWCIGE